MRRLFLILWTYGCFPVFSQHNVSDTVVNISGVNVTSSRLNTLTTGLSGRVFDSLTLETNRDKSLAGLLSMETMATVKSYGPGNLSTITLRGVSANQTGIYWNGIKLNPPNIETEDLSLLPVSFFSSVRLLKGGVSSLSGSGSTGGGLFLKNEPVFGKGMKYTAGGTLGSYSRYGSYVSVETSGKKMWSKTQALYNNSVNDFPYAGTNGETLYRTNAAHKGYGIMQDFAYREKKQLFTLSAWFQSSDREIPGSVQVPQADAKQTDRSFRIVANLKRFLRKGSIGIKTAWLNSFLHYLDKDPVPQLVIDNTILSGTGVAEAVYNREFIKALFISTGVSYRYDQCRSDAYEDKPVRNNTALFAAVSYFVSKINWRVTLNMRQDFIDGYGMPFSPSLGGEGRIYRFVFGKFNISKGFRAPSFNDLYWFPYGNPDLKPEKSVNAEGGIILKTNSGTTSLNITGFKILIDDYILWLPVSGGYWQPQNIQTVNSEGVEVEGKTVFKINKLKTFVTAGYSYTKSTNRKKTGTNDNSYGKQLIYVPINVFNGKVTFIWKGFTLGYAHSITGIRYTTRDNEHYLPAYDLAELSIGKTFNIKKITVDMKGYVSNLYDGKYYSVAYYPMPGRTFNISLYLFF